MSITTIRRIVQFIFFVLIIYGGYFIPDKLQTPLPEIVPEPGQPSTTRYQVGDLLWVSPDPPAFDIYTPTVTCRFSAKGGVFKSCFLHFLSENLTWLTPWRFVLPHILVFILLAFLLARLWCGWVCPLGSVSDVLMSLRKYAGLAHRRLTPKAAGRLSKLRWTFLLLSLAISGAIALPGLAPLKEQLFLPFCNLCPARILCPLLGATRPCWYNFETTISSTFTILGWLTFVTYYLGFVIRRFWCRICPIGLITSFFNRGGLITLKKEPKKCTRCGVCERFCPLDNRFVYEELQKTTINHPDCIFCLRCLEACPEKGCLKVNILGKTVVSS